MWRQLSGASMLLDYPTNQQSFRNSWQDESACWISSRACWCLLSYTRLPEQLRAEKQVLRPIVPAATGAGQGAEPFWGVTAGPDASALSVCLLDVGGGSLLPLPTLWVGAQLSSAGGKKRRWDLHAGIQREQMLSHRLSDYMCMYANTSMFNHKTTLGHRGTLPHTACRCSVQTGAGAPAAPHTHISCPPRICVVHLSPVSHPGTFHTGPTGTKCCLMSFLNYSMCHWCLRSKPQSFLQIWGHFRLPWCCPKADIWRHYNLFFFIFLYIFF